MYSLVVIAGMFPSFTVPDFKTYDACMERFYEVAETYDAAAKKIDTDKAWDFRIFCRREVKSDVAIKALLDKATKGQKF